MTDKETFGADDGLDFDHAVPSTPSSEAPPGAGSVRCMSCDRAITTNYFTANGAPICESCRVGLENATAPVRQPAMLAKAALFGLGAAIVGAVIYWAVMRYTGYEIGLVAILSGWMVGKAIRFGAIGRGGRMLQITAALLTYASVGMAYLPFALQSVAAGSPEGSVSIFAAIFFALSLPVIVVMGSFPSGLISAAIIGFGMLQAWQLTSASAFTFEGPFRVGGASES